MIMNRAGGCAQGFPAKAVLKKSAFSHSNNTFTPHAKILLIGRDLSGSGNPSNYLINPLSIIHRRVNHVEGCGP
jgi:hypothetical protein